MENSKTWSYDELTAVTESEISALLALAASEPPSKGRNYARDAQSCAQGMFLNWMAITNAYRNEEDARRLRALALGGSKNKAI